MNPNDPVVLFVQALNAKGMSAESAMSFFKDLQFEALGNLMLKKGYITKAEWDGEHGRLAQHWQDYFNKMPHLNDAAKQHSAQEATKTSEKK